MSLFAIVNATIVNEGRIFPGAVMINGEFISRVIENHDDIPEEIERIDAGGKLLIPGVIDCHVHFREPGLTHKADIASESKAAVAGGITSYFEMPNTIPQTVTLELLEEKFRIASEKSLANYSFFLGASNDNLQELVQADPTRVCGVKVFFGASTGNMLVDNLETLENIFRLSPLPVIAHCEDESLIRSNSEAMKKNFGDQVPVEMHPVIRSEEACFRSTSLAVDLAEKYGTRLHVAHVSTLKELSLFDREKRPYITSEACVHYLWFSDANYPQLGTRIKVNPAIKSELDRKGLIEGLKNGKIDIVATDHAPHLISEKEKPYFAAPSGTPMVQHSLVAMLELERQGEFDLKTLVSKMCHAPATCYHIDRRGYIRPGYYADLLLIDRDRPWTVTPGNIISKCGWSAFEGTTFQSQVTHTFINGELIFRNGEFVSNQTGKRIQFNR
jgi:dihydroorotase